jgi:hypothetical protein
MEYSRTIVRRVVVAFAGAVFALAGAVDVGFLVAWPLGAVCALQPAKLRPVNKLLTTNKIGARVMVYPWTEVRLASFFNKSL